MRNPRKNTRLRSLAVLAALLATGCDQPTRGTPPLRPMLHTEVEDPQTVAPPGWEEWTDASVDPHRYPGTDGAVLAVEDDDAFELTTPEGLIYSTYNALTKGETARIHALALDEDGLVSFARVPSNRSEERAEALQEALASLARGFFPESSTDARPDGLASLIQPALLTLGPPRNVDGAIVPSLAEADMVSGSTLRVHILGTSIDFEIQFPRLIKDSDGRWWLSEAPRVSNTWSDFRRPGLDLKPELLLSQHAAFPFDVGNYWHYEVKVLSAGNAANADDVQPTRALGYRDTVADIYNGSSWLVATIRRTFADPARTPQTRYLLVTTRHIYPCTLECYRRRSNLTFLLGYMSRTTPFLIQPATRTQSWREGGRVTSGARAGRERATRVAELQPSEIVVPAGAFAQNVLLRAADGGTGPSFVFVNGVGIVREEQRDAAGIQQANLVQYRIFR